MKRILTLMIAFMTTVFFTSIPVSADENKASEITIQTGGVYTAFLNKEIIRAEQEPIGVVKLRKINNMDNAYQVTGLAPGKTTLLFTAQDGEIIKKNVQVTPSYIKVLVDTEKYEMKPADVYDFSVKTEPPHLSDINVTATTDNSSVDIKKISDSKFRISARSVGNSTISIQINGVELSSKIQIIIQETALKQGVTNHNRESVEQNLVFSRDIFPENLDESVELKVHDLSAQELIAIRNPSTIQNFAKCLMQQRMIYLPSSAKKENLYQIEFQLPDQTKLVLNYPCYSANSQIGVYQFVDLDKMEKLLETILY